MTRAVLTPLTSTTHMCNTPADEGYMVLQWSDGSAQIMIFPADYGPLREPFYLHCVYCPGCGEKVWIDPSFDGPHFEGCPCGAHG